jgi:hypothetical protein
MKIAKLVILTFVLTYYWRSAQAQESSKFPLYVGEPIMADTASTLFIPVLYNPKLFSSNKLGLLNNYYANIIFYNFITDSSKKVFDKDTYIENFVTYNNYDERKRVNRNITSSCILYKVYNVDYDKNRRVDHNDPAILYISDKEGNNLKALTTPNENVASIEIFDKQNFALIKMQRDVDNDHDFEIEDKDYYLVKVDLKTLTLGNKIELK